MTVYCNDSGNVGRCATIQFRLPLVMVYVRIRLGLCSVHTWTILCAYLDYTLRILGLYSAHTWIIRCAYLDYTQRILGLYSAHTWIIRCIHLMHTPSILNSHIHSHPLASTHIHSHSRTFPRIHSHSLTFTHIHAHPLTFTHIHSHPRTSTFSLQCSLETRNIVTAHRNITNPTTLHKQRINLPPNRMRNIDQRHRSGHHRLL
jgi:hypothetical protein